MKHILLFGVIILGILSSCSNDEKYFDEYEKKETILQTTRANATEKPIIHYDSPASYGIIHLAYSHPLSFSNSWKMYLQYKCNSQWIYYNPSGYNGPYPILSGYGTKIYEIPVNAQYIPKGNPIIRIRVEQDYSPYITSAWSDEYMLKNCNYSGISDINFGGTGPSVLQIEDYIYTDFNAQSAKVTITVTEVETGYFSQKIYNTDFGVFKTRIGVEVNKTYRIHSETRYIDRYGYEIYPYQERTTEVHTCSGYMLIKLF